MDAYYMKPNDKARVASELMNPVPSSCKMVFYYHMLGKSMGSLTVFKEINGTRTQIFKKAGNQGVGWKRGEAVFSEQLNKNQAFKVVFEGMRGPGVESDIALDDIAFTDCQGKSWVALKTNKCLHFFADSTFAFFSHIRVQQR